ncbi:zinc finger MYM-type protein 4-like isoform X2 [Mytilus trossulus]|uniref:zinc finger MYM-type protein 4-like isoform X2 n=1 Tax=Mytilus trossulus TaxID=6551 RepID=UPI00300572AA
MDEESGELLSQDIIEETNAKQDPVSTELNGDQENCLVSKDLNVEENQRINGEVGDNITAEKLTGDSGETGTSVSGETGNRLTDETGDGSSGDALNSLAETTDNGPSVVQASGEGEVEEETTVSLEVGDSSDVMPIQLGDTSRQPDDDDDVLDLMEDNGDDLKNDQTDGMVTSDGPECGGQVTDLPEESVQVSQTKEISEIIETTEQTSDLVEENLIEDTKSVEPEQTGMSGEHEQVPEVSGRNEPSTEQEDYDVLDLNDESDLPASSDQNKLLSQEDDKDVIAEARDVIEDIKQLDTETENQSDMETKDEISQSGEKDDVMEVCKDDTEDIVLNTDINDDDITTTNDQEDCLLNTEMEAEPEDASTMETGNDAGEINLDTGEMVQSESGVENVDMEKADEPIEAVMENEELEKDVDMVGSEEKENIEDKNKNESEADVSMEILEDKEKTEVGENVDKEKETDVSQPEDSTVHEAAVDSDGGLKITQVESIVDLEKDSGEKENGKEVYIAASEGEKESGEKETTQEKAVTANKEGEKDEAESKVAVNTTKEKTDQPEETLTTENKNDKEEVAESKTDTDDVQIVEKPKEEEIDIIDLDSDTEKEVKTEKTDGTSGIQIASVSGGTDISSVKESEKVKVEAKKDVKPAVPVKQEVKPEVRTDNKSPKSKIQTCIVCKKVGKCKYNIVRNGDIKHLCDDDCFKRFRSNPTTYLRSSTPPQPPPQEPKTAAPANNQHGQFKTCQVCQVMNINASTAKPFLNWQGMDFCGEDCLGKFQSSLNTSCSSCSNVIQQATKGKFCFKFGNQIRQFCSQGCYNDFLKKQKLCECCQKDITKSSDAFVAPAGPDSSFKDFCSQSCLQKYEEKNNRDIEITGVDPGKKSGPAPKGTHTCSVCSNVNTMKHQVQLEGKTNYLCGDPCFSAFQYANKLTMNTCDNCGIYCYNEGMHPQYIQFEGQQKRFCSFMCVNTFKTLNKKGVSCSWCNCKKSNFDMIERVDANNKYQLFCSLNCLSLYRVNLQATSNQAVLCDQCKRYVPAQYHLTMSDASVRNFCSYNCVMKFQSQFTSNAAPSGTATTGPKPGGIQTRSTTRPPQPVQHKPANPQTAIRSVAPQNMIRPPLQNRPTNPNMNQIPIISNVVSLAPQVNQQVNFKSNQQVPLVINNKNTNIRTTVPAQATQTIQTVIIQPPQPKTIKNKSCLCKPFVQTKATSCRPHTQTKETQTDKDMEPQNVLIPIPIPFYVPVPMAMYSQPTPIPFPFPIPIPIPCFIPTTKKSTNSILKHIKEIREKIPDDPLEAELLMMAEAVSAVAKDSSDSESENEAEMEPVEEPEVPEKPADLGEDMLQMALRMATEMTPEPVMDLEETIEPVPVSTEPPPKPKPKEQEDTEDEEEDDEYTPVRETRSQKGKGTKRSGSNQARRRSKRQKAPVVLKAEESPAPEPEPEPVNETPPDANMYLKYTYGVNAWKHWVVLKNNQLDKVTKQGSGKLKLFKTDMLQCSADELNYSLCLFVKEVRKPNGEEYAPDSIYYLCIGIQMFLFENERIDNIFTDIYYEKFTECLNEVLQRYTPKLNAAAQIVCRIEEEHLWECKQLGAHSPHVLLNTLVYFNTKFFQLKTPEDHLKLSFTHIMKHWKKTPVGKGNTQGRSVYLRYYCPAPVRPASENNRKKKEELPVYEQAENLDNPLRCPVKLYEFYLSKCPESIKNRSDAFYLVPERSCVPDSPVWYSTSNLQTEAMNKMLNRTLLVREIQESFIHTQPIYA